MNYDYEKNYKNWLNAPEVDEETKAELLNITDEKEIEDRFYRDLNFGTAGLRGIIGAGSNRMNNYVVRRATQGIADYIIKHAGEEGASRGVAISYDCRYFSDTFAKEAALVLAANGIKAYLFDELKPTPELSFAVRHLGAIAGINITASHNTSEYNGYKVYWEDGGQLPPHVSDAVLEYINNTEMFGAKRIDEEEAKAKGLLHMIGEDVDNAFLENVYKQSILKGNVPEDFKLVYTPIHGTGRKLVSRILEMAGFRHVAKVEAQELPDGGFPTVKAPNPENRECFDLAFVEAEKIGADLIIATDPDADRVGIAVKTGNGEFVTLSGNQVGAMLTHYILTARKEKGMLPENAAVISTIVSTNMTKAICEKFGVKFIETLTGFKFIGEKILEFEKTGSNEFMLGFEESYGYLAGTHARDKDAVVASMLIAEMAAYYASKGVTLYEEMKNMYKTYGGFSEETVSITMPGIDGLAKIQEIMSNLRNSKPEKIGEFDVLAIRDYSSGVRYDLVNKTEEKLTLPKADVLYFELSDGVNFVARPSGTEPKIKLYYLTSGACENCSSKKLEKIKNTVQSVYFA